MRPTTVPSAITSKSSSFHSPEGRFVDARLRISECMFSQKRFEQRFGMFARRRVKGLVRKPSGHE
jgi:hypothetical protein